MERKVDTHIASQTVILEQRYSYDALGRIEDEIVIPEPATYAMTPAIMTYDNDDRITGWQSGAANITPGFDDDGNMIAAGQLLYEETGGVISVYHADSRGSTLTISNSTGGVTNRITYGTYGEIVAASGTLSTPFLNNGAFGVQTDDNGLFHMRARYYSPELRRFVNADPIRFAGGMNWFGYAAGDPVTYFDPSGLYFGEPAVNYVTDAIVNPSNGTVGGFVVTAIEGAGEGASAYFDGFVPIFDPFQSFYNAENSTYQAIGLTAALTREGVTAALGAAAAN